MDRQYAPHREYWWKEFARSVLRDGLSDENAILFLYVSYSENLTAGFYPTSEKRLLAIDAVYELMDEVTEYTVFTEIHIMCDGIVSDAVEPALYQYNPDREETTS